MANDFNPYASPETPPGSAGFDPERTLVACFPLTWRVHSKMALRMAQGWYLRTAWSFLLTPLFVYGLRWLIPGSVLDGGEGWLVAALIPLMIVCLAEQVGWWLALQRLRRDSLLGPRGDWRVTIDLVSITLQTPGGVRQWPLGQADLDVYEKSVTMLVDPKTALYVPATAKFGEESFAVWKETANCRWQAVRR